MVLGYICNEHGYQGECDVGKAGERLCYECEVAVTGLTGYTRSTSRSPPTDKTRHASGEIKWVARGYDTQVWVNAFDLEDAVERAIEKVDEPQDINEIMPQKRKYRH